MARNALGQNQQKRETPASKIVCLHQTRCPPASQRTMRHELAADHHPAGRPGQACCSSWANSVLDKGNGRLSGQDWLGTLGRPANRAITCYPANPDRDTVEQCIVVYTTSHYCLYSDVADMAAVRPHDGTELIYISVLACIYKLFVVVSMPRNWVRLFLNPIAKPNPNVNSILGFRTHACC